LQLLLLFAWKCALAKDFTYTSWSTLHRRSFKNSVQS